MDERVNPLPPVSDDRVLYVDRDWRWNYDSAVSGRRVYNHIMQKRTMDLDIVDLEWLYAYFRRLGCTHSYVGQLRQCFAKIEDTKDMTILFDTLTADFCKEVRATATRKWSPTENPNSAECGRCGVKLEARFTNYGHLVGCPNSPSNPNKSSFSAESEIDLDSTG